MKIIKVTKVYKVSKRTKKGNIETATAIPAVVRDRLGIDKGDYLVWYDHEGRICIAKGKIVVDEE